MRYLGTGFTLTLGGMRLRLSLDLDDAPDHDDLSSFGREDESNLAGTSQHGTRLREQRPAHHLRSHGT